MADVTYDIDSVCEEYEEFRGANNVGPDSVRIFLDRIYPNAAHDISLLTELIQIDIQLNWMSWDKSLSAITDSSSSVSVLGQFLQIPRLRNYIQSFPCLAEIGSECLPLLARCELASRGRWGDSIGCAYYLENYGILLEADKQTFPKLVKCMFDGSSIGKGIPCFELRGRTLLGRQRSRDASDSFCEELADGNRIVVANKYDTYISREQLAVQILNSTHAIITNLSSGNSILIANFGTVEPNQSVVIKFDFAVRLPNRRLHFSAT
ncbi:MAG: hypothetical protein MUC83_12700 [Pirellula sp.]|jgi:hypothetical protein|nr:hypothetical protein [Pirellula sp.]